jgi:predicted amidohydrolase
VLLSLGPLIDKYWFAEEARVLSQEMGLKLYATHAAERRPDRDDPSKKKRGRASKSACPTQAVSHTGKLSNRRREPPRNSETHSRRASCTSV